MTRLPAILFAFFGFLMSATSFLVSGAGCEVQTSDFGKSSEGVSVYRYVLTSNI